MKYSSGEGFTLVELLVVISIIGVLVALLLPAVQAAREAARRSQCTNNLKQLGLALLNHESAKGGFPAGTISTRMAGGAPRTPWIIHLYPYLEAQNIYDRYEFGAGGGQEWSHPTNCVGPDAPVATPVPGMLCPSDGMGGAVQEVPWWPAGGRAVKGNYSAFFGEFDFTRTWRASLGIPPGLLHAFKYNEPVELRHITDGASNTMALGEVLTGTGSGTDTRGSYFQNGVGGTFVFTRTPPNSPIPDIRWPGACTPEYNRPELNLPCLPGSSREEDTFAASRSRHPGGVHVAFCDGSVHFISDSVGLFQWQAFGSIAGNETTYGIE